MKTVEQLTFDTGISEKNREEMANQLSPLLADLYLLYLKTQNFHWNVTGPFFTNLHELFEKQYQKLLLEIDQVAERIRALGVMSPGSFQDFLELATLEENTGVRHAQEMILLLAEDHAAVIREARIIYPHAEHMHDQATVDLLAELMESHEKNLWMLKNLLETA